VVIAFGYKRIELTEEADLRALLDLGRLSPVEGESADNVAALRGALERGYAGEVSELVLSDAEAHTLNQRVLRHASLAGQELSPGLGDLRKGLEAYIAELGYRDEAGR
jgi:Na+-translocating ferredoxin:NAD+ oxidoreductase RnfG subunit